MKNKKFQPTRSCRREVSTWPLGVKDIINHRVQIEDEYRHRNSPALPLPAPQELHHTFELTPASAAAMGWDMFKKGLWRAMP